MSTPTLHLLGIPHTYTHPKFSCCAFTGKVLRFAPMMIEQGYNVIHYGNEGSKSGANEEVQILDSFEYNELGGCEPNNSQYGKAANADSRLYKAFNNRLNLKLEERVNPGDIICLPFGSAHSRALHGENTKTAYFVETGIGYPKAFAPYRIYESYAWMYCHMGRENPGVILGNDYWWVAPNYYDLDDWPLVNERERKKDTIVFMGRLNSDKGLEVIMEIAKRRPNIKFVLCGQGNAAPWTILPNVTSISPFHGPAREGRAAFLGTAAAVITPTRYVEPFGGVAAEALLCGTPVIASSFGAFPEYISHESNGWLCRTLQDWLDAVDMATKESAGMTYQSIREDAGWIFGMEIVGQHYAQIFRQISNLGDGGWYHNQSLVNERK